MPFAASWMDLENIRLSEISHIERQILHDITCMWNLKIIQINLYTKQKFTVIENKFTVTKREREGGRDKLGVWD